jgi:hypothetical protein
MGGSRVLMHLPTISRHELTRLAKSAQLEDLLNGTSTDQTPIKSDASRLVGG